ncbi:hypothetical protein SAMD00079811_28080 [Scytonema sp. HK-05]|nr:hypothetical protein SAMD00079811_28080 [Scytonema sp. HK-05]
MGDENSANNILSKTPRLIFCGKRENCKIGEVKRIANNILVIDILQGKRSLGLST